MNNKNGVQMNVGMNIEPITMVEQKKDMLVDILEHQGKLENEIYHKSYGVTLDGLTDLDRCMMIKDTAYFVEEEIHEMTRELPYMKHWKQYKLTEEEMKECFVKSKKEFIDAVHFIMNIAVLFDMSPEEMHAMYMDKNAINFDRQKNNY